MNIVYVRYNRHRLRPFQIETSILALNGAKTVIKRALTPEAADHIRAIRSGYDLIQLALNAGRLVLPRLTGFDGSSISFQYMKGESLERLLFQSFRSRDKASLFRIIDDYCALLKEAFPSVTQPNRTSKISEVFGINALDHAHCTDGWLPLAVIDAIFENIIISGKPLLGRGKPLLGRGKSYFLIDNEWVFEGSVPMAFVVFRSLFYFHRVKYFELGIEKWVPFEELLEHCRILPEQAERYREMEENFQAYIFGAERCFKYKEQYKKREISVHQLEETIEHQRELVRKLHNAIHEITDSFGWRLWQKIAGVLNFLCPGGLRRRIAGRLFSILKSR